MPEQDLNDADVHALLEHVRGKAVAKRVRPEPCRRSRTRFAPYGMRPVRSRRARWVTIRRLGNSHRSLRWIFQTSRSMSRIDSVSGRARSLFRLPITRRTICFESTAVTGSVTASLIRKP